ncbi:MAG: fumarylacetoacetate hydrolase family protein [Bryobacterales bacterium]|nr:fumarylacetoacetate hydrolase family protein [Bryobacterales bacterium]
MARAQEQSGVRRYARFRAGERTAYGLVAGETVAEFDGGLFGARRPNGKTHRLSAVELLYPVEPSKVLALARNYRSHLNSGAAPAPEPKRPEFFYKPPASLQHPGKPIVLPPDSTDVHYECEMVVVIGKRAHNVTKAEAASHVFGITAGNDVSERQWQGGPDKDIQWWRAKGSDTFGPMGPYIVTGLDYAKLAIQTRLNGKVMQKDSTGMLIFDVPSMISFASRYVTLEPGDVIFTGTPGRTTAMKKGDTVEVELEGVGVLRNPVA